MQKPNQVQNVTCSAQSFRLRLSNRHFKFRCAATFALCILHFILFTACSIPNLEPPECTQARGVVKELYSYHFGNDMRFTTANLQPREKFLSPELTKLLQKFVSESDPFTLTDDFPKAFRVGGCKVIDANKADVQILLFWRDDTRTEQREIHVETVKENDKWLIDNIYNDQVNLKNNLNH